MATKEIIAELIEKLQAVDNEIKLLQEDRKELLDEYKEKLDMKAFKAALKIVKARENVDQNELENILDAIDG
jgi:uncharacterized protein (UPF0335 family)